MAEFVSLFVSGFEGTVSRHIPRELGGAEIIRVSGGLAHYKYAGKPEFVARLPFINNSFVVLAKYRGAGLAFDKIVYDTAKKTFRHVGNYKSFRVRFSLEGQFEKVPKSLFEIAESAIMRNCEMHVNRVKPECEFWFIVRRDGSSYFGQLLGGKPGGKPNSGELNSGELRQELAGLLCLDCEFDKSTVVCDPFAGYGSIPLYIHNHCEYDKMYVNDIDAGLVSRLSKGVLGRDARVKITRADAAGLSHIGRSSVDIVITDPPWGYVGQYGDISEFYRGALKELKRIIKPDGRIVLLTGRPAEFTGAARHCGLNVLDRINILVNGKKAGVFTLGKPTA